MLYLIDLENILRRQNGDLVQLMHSLDRGGGPLALDVLLVMKDDPGIFGGHCSTRWQLKNRVRNLLAHRVYTRIRSISFCCVTGAKTNRHHHIRSGDHYEDGRDDTFCLWMLSQTPALLVTGDRFHNLRDQFYGFDSLTYYIQPLQSKSLGNPCCITRPKPGVGPMIRMAPPSPVWRGNRIFHSPWLEWPRLHLTGKGYERESSPVEVYRSINSLR